MQKTLRLGGKALILYSFFCFVFCFCFSRQGFSIAAITGRTQTKAKLPTHTEVKNFEGLDRESIVLLEQIRTIDKKRLKQYMGMMPAEAMARVDKALAISIALKNGLERNCAK